VESEFLWHSERRGQQQADFPKIVGFGGCSLETSAFWLAAEAAFRRLYSDRSVASAMATSGVGLLFGFDELSGGVADRVFYAVQSVVS
jgi:hypothetical protein